MFFEIINIFFSSSISLIFINLFIFRTWIQLTSFFESDLSLPRLSTNNVLELFLVGCELNDIKSDIEIVYLQYLKGQKSNKFSTNKQGNHHFETTRAIVKNEMEFLDYKTRVRDTIKLVPSRYIYKVMHQDSELYFVVLIGLA